MKSWQFTVVSVCAILFGAYLVFVQKAEVGYAIVTYVLGLWSTPPVGQTGLPAAPTVPASSSTVPASSPVDYAEMFKV